MDSLDWVPSGTGMAWVRCGELGWHTLTLPKGLGDRVLADLGEASGAVVQEDEDHRLTWLTEPKPSALSHLRGHPQVTLSGDDGSFLFIPGVDRRHLVWWRIPPAPDRLLTDADRLADAIATYLPETRR
ncbi:hypothetical protein [Streptomyces youssoufiensis]